MLIIYHWIFSLLIFFFWNILEFASSFMLYLVGIKRTRIFVEENSALFFVGKKILWKSNERTVGLGSNDEDLRAFANVTRWFLSNFLGINGQNQHERWIVSCLKLKYKFLPCLSRCISFSIKNIHSKLNVYMCIYIQEYCKKKLSNRGRIKIFQK